MKTFLFSGLTFSLLCISFLCFSQTKQDTITIRQFLRSAESFKNSNVDSMLFFNAKAIGFSQKVHNEKYLSFAYQQLASYYFEKDNFEKSTEYFLRALKIDEGRKDTYRIAELNGELSEIYYKLEKFEKAMGYLETALKLYSSISDSMNIARMYCHIGKLHGAREYCETRSVEQKRIDYTTAIDYLNKCLDICLRHDWQEGVCNAYLNLASVYNRFNMSKQALVYVLRTYDYYKKRNDLDGISNTLFNLAITYRKLKQYSKAIDYYKETIAFGKKHNMTGGIQFVYEELAQAYYEAGDYKNSRDYYVQYMIARDSTYTLEKSKQIFELETQYQTEKKEKQILALTLEKERKQRNFYIILSGIFIAALGAAYYVLRTRSRATIAEKNNHINEQKIDQMEKERQLIAVHAVLHGEETERTRLAR
ncbi:MAG TPA: tetratricopeptide repeat protein, partial [Bacteroidales bacterium]|nr:tetratricopeptide repeat protein [Bacteroidales bacterium]